MVLNDVARDAGGIEIAAALLDADRLRDRELHVVNVLTIPERLENAVRESQHEQVLNGFFAEVVIDAEDLPFAEGGDCDSIQLARRFEIVSERLLDDRPRERTVPLRIIHHSFCAEELADGREEIRRDGEVVDAASAGAARPIALRELFLQAQVRAGIAEIAADVEESLREVLPHRVIDGTRARVLVARFANVHSKCFVGVVGT